MRKGVLSRKQVWRKTQLKYSEENDNFYDKDNYDNIDQIFKDDKNVSFDSIVRVILIPEIKDYSDNFLHSSLWYSQDDYFGFIRDRDNELYKSKNNSF
jgi:hypothetical protein